MTILFGASVSGYLQRRIRKWGIWSPAHHRNSLSSTPDPENFFYLYFNFKTYRDSGVDKHIESSTSQGERKTRI